MFPFTRREVLQQWLAAGAGLSLGGATPLFAAARVKKVGANDRINVAVMGIRGRGRSHISAFCGMKETQVVALCDVDTREFARGIKSVEQRQGKPPRCEQDIRRLLDDKNIDAISIATPNHWHSLATIWAIQAGKDVYVEKPSSHNVSEGRRTVEFARKHGRIVQHGTQGRSSGGIQAAIDYIRSGKLGKVTIARALCYKRRGSIGKVNGPQPIPPEVDYNLWLGPAPKKPLTRKRLHYDWHWFWDYGNGDIGNQGVHQMDIARWGLGKETLPTRALSLGGRFGYVDDGETPNTQIAFLDYGDSQLIFEVRGLNTDALLGAKIGNIFYGTEGYIVIARGRAALFDRRGNKVQDFTGSGESHFANFVRAVQSRNRDDLNADIVHGHLSSGLCHLANISYRLGTLVPFNRQTKAFGDDKEAYETLERMEEHLSANGIKLEETKYRLGRKLRFNPGEEKFVGDSEADQLLTRNYRAPFVVPEKVS